MRDNQRYHALLTDQLGMRQADVARGIKEECEAELAVALPILQDALAALDTIKVPDVAYMRKHGNPPAAIKLVLEARSARTCLGGNQFKAMFKDAGCKLGLEARFCRRRRFHAPYLSWLCSWHLLASEVFGYSRQKLVTVTLTCATSAAACPAAIESLNTSMLCAINAMLQHVLRCNAVTGGMRAVGHQAGQNQGRGGGHRSRLLEAERGAHERSRVPRAPQGL